MSEAAGKINAYACKTCGHRTITITRADGTTPFAITCRARGCTGNAYSAFYRVPAGMTPTHEWYRPTPGQMRGMDDATRQHVRMGGLLLRRITALDPPPLERPLRRLLRRLGLRRRKRAHS